MKVILAAMLATSLSGSALAQYTSTPNNYGGPQDGTTSPDGASATAPDGYGTPDYGKATRTWRTDLRDDSKPYRQAAVWHHDDLLLEGSWGAQIADELKPQDGEHIVIKKGYGGFSNTPLDSILRYLGVATCIVAGVTTTVCVSTTLRGGVGYKYHMLPVENAVAETDREPHEAEIKILALPLARRPRRLPVW